MCGRTKPSFNWTSTVSAAWWPECPPTTSARTANAGATRYTTGKCCTRLATLGGWIASAPRVSALDALRLDHFIGFHRYWEIPCQLDSARDGRFVGVPGADFFAKVNSSLGHLPFIAEDLGLVTPEVGALRDHFGMPGMRVLEFAFVDDARDYQPHRFPKQTVVYTGTHDNDTIVGWLTSHERQRAEHDAHKLRDERMRALRYAGSDGNEPHWDMIRVALMSAANTAIFPLQDLLGLGTEARMNIPGTASGNWEFRALEGEFEPHIADRMASMCEELRANLGRYSQDWLKAWVMQRAAFSIESKRAAARLIRSAARVRDRVGHRAGRRRGADCSRRALASQPGPGQHGSLSATRGHRQRYVGQRGYAADRSGGARAHTRRRARGSCLPANALAPAQSRSQRHTRARPPWPSATRWKASRFAATLERERA